METASFNKTILALAVAGTLATVGTPQAEANVENLSWRGAFTTLNPAGGPISNSPSDYAGAGYPNGYYANGDGATYTFGAPYFPHNAANGIPNTYYAGAINTIHGWKGRRTPISGTIAYDTFTGAGVGTVNPFFFFGDTPGSGDATNIARTPGITFQAIDTIGTLVGSMMFSWNGGGLSVSIVMDASGLFASLPAMIAGGPTSNVSGVGALPATDNINFGSARFADFLPLGPTPIATKTLNALGCEGQLLATQVDANTINPTGNIANCDLSQDDGIGGSPLVSSAFADHNLNLDFMSIHYDSFAITEPPVPLPPAVWLFGSGLLGLISLARRKRTASSGPII